MRILITGGSGFVGQAFRRAARESGHVLANLSRQAPDTSRDVHLPGSLAAPPWPEIERFAPDACVHAAWITTPGIYLESPENADWERWSLDFLGRLPALGVRQVVALGTCVEYRMGEVCLGEARTPLDPRSAYARAKCRVHAALRPVLGSAAVPFAWARLFYPYGEGEHPERLIRSLVRRLRADTTVTLRTPHSVKDYIHVDDVATALLAMLETRFDGAINLGTGTGIAVEVLARRLAAMLGRPELIEIPANPPSDPLDRVVADSTRLRSLGWTPRVELEQGLWRMIPRAGTDSP